MSPICECNTERETVGHFLLECPMFVQQRTELMSAVSEVFSGVVTEKVVLGTSLREISYGHIISLF